MTVPDSTTTSTESFATAIAVALDSIMATQVQFRRGTTAEHSGFEGVDGEVTVDTSLKTVVINDALTNGGFPVLRQDGSNSQFEKGSTTNVH